MSGYIKAFDDSEQVKLERAFDAEKKKSLALELQVAGLVEALTKAKPYVFNAAMEREEWPETLKAHSALAVVNAALTTVTTTPYASAVREVVEAVDLLKEHTHKLAASCSCIDIPRFDCCTCGAYEASNALAWLLSKRDALAKLEDGAK